MTGQGRSGLNITVPGSS